MIPEPTTVWAVRLDVSTEDFKGVLHLEPALAPGALVFREETGDVDIPLASIQKVKRLRATPVLMVTQFPDAGAGRFAFYFVKPPPLTPTKASGSGRHKRRAIVQLQATGRSLKSIVQEWEEAVKQAQAAGAAS